MLNSLVPEATTPQEGKGKNHCLPFLTFHGNAEEAMNFYASVLPGASIDSLVTWAEGQPGDTGKVLSGYLSFKGQTFMFMDMEQTTDCPPFVWSTSFFIECDSEAEFDAIHNALAEGGQVMMGPMPIMHIRKCSWVVDKFGVTWQPVWE